MTHTTRFLSRLFGLYCLIVALYMVGHREAMLELIAALVHDAPLLFTLGVLTTLGGLALVLAHNVWSGGIAPVIVTVLGWATLLKGILFLWFSSQGAADFYLGTLRYGELFYFYCAVSLALGAFLAYTGFKKG
jgi:vacuolar-type H+-ATPase subunit I/STV1